MASAQGLTTINAGANCDGSAAGAHRPEESEFHSPLMKASQPFPRADNAKKKDDDRISSLHLSSMSGTPDALLRCWFMVAGSGPRATLVPVYNGDSAASVLDRFLYFAFVRQKVDNLYAEPRYKNLVRETKPQVIEKMDGLHRFASSTYSYEILPDEHNLRQELLLCITMASQGFNSFLLRPDCNMIPLLTHVKVCGKNQHKVYELLTVKLPELRDDKPLAQPFVVTANAVVLDKKAFKRFNPNMEPYVSPLTMRVVLPQILSESIIFHAQNFNDVGYMLEAAIDKKLEKKRISQGTNPAPEPKNESVGVGTPKLPATNTVDASEKPANNMMQKDANDPTIPDFYRALYRRAQLAEQNPGLEAYWPMLFAGVLGTGLVSYSLTLPAAALTIDGPAAASPRHYPLTIRTRLHYYRCEPAATTIIQPAVEALKAALLDALLQGDTLLKFGREECSGSSDRGQRGPVHRPLTVAQASELINSNFSNDPTTYLVGVMVPTSGGSLAGAAGDSAASGGEAGAFSYKIETFRACDSIPVYNSATALKYAFHDSSPDASPSPIKMQLLNLSDGFMPRRPFAPPQHSPTRTGAGRGASASFLSPALSRLVLGHDGPTSNSRVLVTQVSTDDLALASVPPAGIADDSLREIHELQNKIKIEKMKNRVKKQQLTDLQAKYEKCIDINGAVAAEREIRRLAPIRQWLLRPKEGDNPNNIGYYCTSSNNLSGMNASFHGADNVGGYRNYSYYSEPK